MSSAFVMTPDFIPYDSENQSEKTFDCIINNENIDVPVSKEFYHLMFDCEIHDKSLDLTEQKTFDCVIENHHENLSIPIPEEFYHLMFDCTVHEDNEEESIEHDEQIQLSVPLNEELRRHMFPSVFDENIPLNTEIPSWIKQAGDFWVQGQTTDREFASSIAYLVRSDIIPVSDIDLDPNGDIVIDENIQLPDWIKNTITWWVSGAISDSEFQSGVKFLLEEKIINFKENKNFGVKNNPSTPDFNDVINTHSYFDGDPCASHTVYFAWEFNDSYRELRDREFLLRGDNGLMMIGSLEKEGNFLRGSFQTTSNTHWTIVIYDPIFDYYFEGFSEFETISIINPCNPPEEIYQEPQEDTPHQEDPNPDESLIDDLGPIPSIGLAHVISKNVFAFDDCVNESTSTSAVATWIFSNPEYFEQYDEVKANIFISRDGILLSTEEIPQLNGEFVLSDDLASGNYEFVLSSFLVLDNSTGLYTEYPIDEIQTELSLTIPECQLNSGSLYVIDKWFDEPTYLNGNIAGAWGNWQFEYGDGTKPIRLFVIISIDGDSEQSSPEWPSNDGLLRIFFSPGMSIDIIDYGEEGVYVGNGDRLTFNP